MKPWRGAFGPEEAAHLLRRAAFVPSPGEIERAVADGPEATVGRLLGGATPARVPLADLLDAQLRDSDDREALAGALLARLGATTEPLRETLCLFWHNHFVSALSKGIEGRMMLDQVALFRARGAGRFTDLATAVARDPAMVRYLDSEKSTRAAPNENFARELLELFTTGPGPYGEADIREAARAFTAYHLDGGAFAWSEASEDRGTKRILGREGPFTGDDVVRICCEHEATAGHLARKLACAFVSDEPGEEVVAAIAAAWRRTGGDTGAVVRTLLVSEAFYAPAHRFALTRSPAALVAATLRGLPVSLPPRELARTVQGMGQTLLDPPTVKGYPGGRSWLNPATLLARRTFLIRAAEAATVPADAVPDLARRLLGAEATAEVSRGGRPASPGDPPWRRLALVLLHPAFQRC